MEEESSINLLSPGRLVNSEELSTFLINEMEMIYIKLSNKQSEKYQKSNIFIGAHPVSMDKENISLLRQHKYFICEKSDGVRYFLIILNDGRFLFHGRNTGNSFNSKLQFYQFESGYESYFNEITLNYHQFYDQLKIKYIFDGELIVDKTPFSRKINYLIFDTIIYDYNGVYDDTSSKSSYACRLNLANRFLQHLKTLRNLKKIEESISFKLKDFFKIEDAPFLTDFYFKKLPHNQDGIIFTRSDFEYKPGAATDGILKWKEPENNTIDFLLVNNKKFDKMFDGQFKNRIIDLYVFNKVGEDTQKVLFDFMIVDSLKYQVILKKIEELREKSEEPLMGIIAECKFDSSQPNPLFSQYFEKSKSFDFAKEILLNAQINNKQNSENFWEQLKKKLEYYAKSNFKCNWKNITWREDKSEPNALRTAENIMKGIMEPLSKNQLLEYIKNLRGNLN